MHSNRFDRREIRTRRAEGGYALVMAIVVLVLVSAVVINLIDYAGDEAKSSGRTRATVSNLYAADSGIQFSMHRIQLPRNLAAFGYSMTDGTRVESRARSDSTPQPIAPAGVGPPPEGFSVNVGGGFVNELFLLNVTSVAANNGVAELEAKLGSLQPNSGAY